MHSMLFCNNRKHRGEPGPPRCSCSTCLCSSGLKETKTKTTSYQGNFHIEIFFSKQMKMNFHGTSSTLQILQWTYVQEDAEIIRRYWSPVSGIPDNVVNVGWPIWGMQGSGLQSSLSAGLSCSSQASEDSMSSDRQRTSRTRKPPSHVFEHWEGHKSVDRVRTASTKYLRAVYTAGTNSVCIKYA